MAQAIRFDGPCPFLSCRETGPHSHPVCPECGAVRYGNLDCPTCRREHGLDTGQPVTTEAPEAAAPAGTPKNWEHDECVQELLQEGVPPEEIQLIDCPYCGGQSYYSGGFTSCCTWCGRDIAKFSDDAYTLADVWMSEAWELP